MKVGNTFVWFCYDKGGREIVAILEGGKGYSGYEVKYRGNVDLRDVTRIAPLKKYFLLSKEDVGGDEQTTIVPMDVFLALLPVSENNI